MTLQPHMSRRPRPHCDQRAASEQRTLLSEQYAVSTCLGAGPCQVPFVQISKLRSWLHFMSGSGVKPHSEKWLQAS